MSTYTLDHHGPGRQLDPGDFIATARAIYRVDTVRPIDSRVWPERWRYGVTKVATHADLAAGWAPPDGTRIITTATYGPGEKPGQPAFDPCGHPACEGCQATA